MKQRILNVLIALDQFLFCLATLGHSSPDETLSAAAWRWEQAGKLRGRVLRPLIDALFHVASTSAERPAANSPAISSASTPATVAGSVNTMPSAVCHLSSAARRAGD